MLCVLASALCQAWDYDTPSLKVRWVWPQQEAMLSEQREVYIELATPNWFTEAARFDLPLDDKVLWLQPQSFAINTNINIDNTRWQLQRWPLMLLMRKLGIYEGAQLTLDVEVANGDQSIQHKVVLTSPKLQIVAPIEDTFLADRLSIERRLEMPAELSVGDTVSITYDLQAEGLLAMFLPTLQPEFSGTASYTIYAGLPSINNVQHRGQMQSSRTQRFDIVITKLGDLRLLAQNVAWLSRQDRQQQVISLEAKDIINSVNTQSEISELPSSLVWGFNLVVLLAMAGIGAIATNLITPQHQYRYTLRQEILAALALGDWQTVSTRLYRLRDSYRNLRDFRMSDVLNSSCVEDDAKRIDCILAAAFAAKPLLRDDQDERRFKQLFLRWQKL